MGGVTTTLCIDIGGTRIKSAILPASPTLAQMHEVSCLGTRTLSWLNASLPDLVDRTKWQSLAAHYQRAGESYDAVSIAVPGPVDPQGHFLRADLTVPWNLKTELRKACGKPVTVIKDADAVMLGFLRYAALAGEEVEYPAVLLSFGRALGLSSATDDKTVQGLEISRLPLEVWDELRKRTRHPLERGWEVHRVVGREYFDWIEDEHRDWPFRKVREEFSLRVAGAAIGLRQGLEPQLGEVKTVVLAGGNAEYISVRGLQDALGCKVIELTARRAKLKPELIGLLGVEAATRYG